MANNRMYLIHKPSKLGICLGKRMAWGWYGAPNQNFLDQFFTFLSENYLEGSQDDFVLAMEDCSESTCLDKWVCTKERIGGFSVFEL